MLMPGGRGRQWERSKGEETRCVDGPRALHRTKPTRDKVEKAKTLAQVLEPKLAVRTNHCLPDFNVIGALRRDRMRVNDNLPNTPEEVSSEYLKRRKELKELEDNPVQTGNRMNAVLAEVPRLRAIEEAAYPPSEGEYGIITEPIFDDDGEFLGVIQDIDDPYLRGPEKLAYLCRAPVLAFRQSSPPTLRSADRTSVGFCPYTTRESH